MKRLILVRHAKSSWSGPATPDQARPLNAQGRQAATRISHWLSANRLQPDQIISSTAQRCRETLERASEQIDRVDDISFDDKLYLADPSQMLEVLQTARGQTVLILGHMPGIGEFAHELRQDPPPHHDMFRKYPTGATTVLNFNINDWLQVQFGTGVLQAYATPADM